MTDIALPEGAGETEYTPPNQGKSIAEKIWDRLDLVVAEILAAKKANSSCVLATIRAEELAWVLVLVCQPYYADTEAVSREAGKRAKMKEGSIAWVRTPGYRYNPPPAGSNVVTVSPGHIRVGGTKVAAKVTAAIPATKKKDLIAALKMGLDVKSLASVYEIPESAINQLCEELGIT